MTERERWIVYPLLFLALGAALRDKLIDTTMSRRIVCQELVVVDGGGGPEGPQPVAQIGAVQPASAGQPALGQILVNGRVDAHNYLINGRSIVPRQQAISPQDFLRLWQRWAEAARRQQQSGAPTEQPAAPSQQQTPPTSTEPNQEPADGAP